jgi:ATP-binding cassette, subfamily B, bacterial
VKDSQWRLIGGLLRPHRRELMLYGAVLALATAVPMGSSLVLSRFVRLAIERAPSSRLAPLAIAYAALGLAASVMTIITTWRSTLLAWRITNDLRNDLASYVLHADLSFHRDRTPGELVSRVDGDITAMTEFLATVVARVIAIVALGIGAVLVCAVVEPAIAPAVAVGLLFVGAVTWSQRDTPTPATVADRAAEADTLSTAEQYLAGADDIAALGASNYAISNMADKVTVAVLAGRKRVRAQMMMQGAVRLALAGAEFIVIAYGAIVLRRGLVDVAGIVLAFRLVLAVRSPVEQLIWRLQEAAGASGAATRVLELVREQRTIIGGDARLPAGPLGVSLQDARLVYDDADADEAALEGLTLAVPVGRHLGLVGRTGSGKTSVARLVLRLVSPTGGAIVLGDGLAATDLASVDEVDLRRRVTAVPQDVQLFPGTVRDNVTLFAAFDDAPVQAALEAVGLGDWLASLPDGLDTRLASDNRDDDGSRVGLSAGQAQLLSVARALLRDPDVVVLDEATSRIDPATQEAIGAAMQQLLHGRTAIVIAHRLATLDLCDDIAVLANGELVEHGSRVALAADPTSRYAQLRAAGDSAEELS